MKKTLSILMICMLFASPCFGAKEIMMTIGDGSAITGKQTAISFKSEEEVESGGGASGFVGEYGTPYANASWNGGTKIRFSDADTTDDGNSGNVRYIYFQRYASNMSMTDSNAGIFSSGGNLLVQGNKSSITTHATNTNLFRWELESTYELQDTTAYLLGVVTVDNDYQLAGVVKSGHTVWEDSTTYSDSSTLESSISKDSSLLANSSLRIWASYDDDDWKE